MNDYSGMSDHDLLIRIAQRTDAIEEHAQKTNGRVDALSKAHLRQEGAVGVLKWLGGVTLSVLLASGAVAGVVLAVVTQNGG